MAAAPSTRAEEAAQADLENTLNDLWHLVCHIPTIDMGPIAAAMPRGVFERVNLPCLPGEQENSFSRFPFDCDAYHLMQRIETTTTLEQLEIFAVGYGYSHLIIDGWAARGRCGNSFMMIAAERNCLNLLRTLPRSFVNEPDGDRGPIHAAAESRNIEAIRVLVCELGADINRRYCGFFSAADIFLAGDSDHNMPCQCTCIRNTGDLCHKHSLMLKELLNMGAMVSECNLPFLLRFLGFNCQKHNQ